MCPADTTDRIRGKVTRIASELREAAGGGYRFRGIELSTGPESPRTFLIIPETLADHGRGDLCRFPALCWRGAEVAADGIELNNRLGDGTLIYHATPDTRLLLEPRRPVSVTDAVEAAICLRGVDLRNRIDPPEPFWMAKGRLVHSLLGHLLSNGSAVTEDGFDAAFARAWPRFKATLPGSKVPLDDAAFRKDARRHFHNLARWLEGMRSRAVRIASEIDGISTRWGLRGRADALFTHSDGETLLELKTGRVASDEHGIQLLAYSLLFEDESGARPDGVLFYSETGRTEPVSGMSPRRLLEGRNRVVALRRAYAFGTPRPDAAGECPRSGRCFNRNACREFYGLAAPKSGPLSRESVRAYYERWFEAVSRELWDTEGEFAEVLDPESLAQRVREGTTTAVRSMSFPDRRGSAVHAVLIVDESAGDAGPGDLIIIHRGDPTAREAFRARIIDRDGEAVRVRIDADPAVDPDPAGESPVTWSDGWYFNKVPFTRPREAARRALYRFIRDGDPAVVRAIVDGWDETAEPIAEITPGKPVEEDPDGTDACELCYAEGLAGELNEDQEAAVTSALDCDVYHLIHGPPGTGKTRVLARLVLHCLDRGERVLVAAPTNVALDRLLAAVMRLGAKDLLRIGGAGSVTDDFTTAASALGSREVIFEDLCTREPSSERVRETARAVPLVGATAYQCAGHPFFLRQRFDRVIIDEAGQLDEPASLAALALAPRFVLGGDHLQLPPVARGCGSSASEPSALERSLFERLFLESHPHRISRLRMQYRMNREIQDIPSRLFYDGALFPAPEAAARRISMNVCIPGDPALEKVLSPAAPVVFVDVPGSAEGKARPREAELAAEIVRNLTASGVPGSEIGLITPYRAQQALIREHLTGGASSVTVDTVDRFQGGEREVIILSLARSDGVTSFLADRKRLNVSLSRARSKLILLGHGPALETHPLFADLLSGIERVSIDE